MKLTKKRAIALHRELWDWLYHHPSKQKPDWPRWIENGGNIERVCAHCFACELCYSCNDCLFIWPKGFCETIRGDGLFNLWCDAESPKIRKKYAKLIRDLKERE